MRDRKKRREAPTQFAILDKGLLAHVDIMRLMMLRLGKRTLLPEIYEIFGDEKAIEFLDIFAGTTIQIPSRSIIENAVRDCRIYVELARNDVDMITKDLAARYDLTTEVVRDIYRNMKSMVRAETSRADTNGRH